MMPETYPLGVAARLSAQDRATLATIAKSGETTTGLMNEIKDVLVEMKEELQEIKEALGEQ